MLAAVAALTLFSCSKENDIQKEEVVVPAEEVTTPADDADVPEGMVRLTFAVSAENDAAPADEDTKTSWNGSTHAWSDGDKIKIFWGTGTDDCVDAEVKDNKVTAVVVDADKYYAVYPSTGAFAFREGGTIDFGISNQQSGSFKDANMMAAVTSKEAATLAFKNLTHIFKFHLTDDSPYDRFQFCTNNGSIVVNTYGVTFDAEGKVTIGTRTEEISGFANSKYVRLHSGMAPGEDYYFAVVPGADYSLGFGLQARLTGSEGGYTAGALSKKPIDTSDPCIITDLGNLDTFVHSDWFITANGTGDGTSWDNPGGPALLRSLLIMPSTFTVNQAKINHTTRLNNAKIHLKEGTYNFQTILADSGVQGFEAAAFSSEVDNVTVIDGGYPSSATGKDLSGYDPVNHPSVIISNQAAQNDRAFYFNGARLYDWTFRGLSFENNPDATEYNTPGGAVAVNNGTNGNIKFEDCSFALTSSNSIGGGALSFRGTAEVNSEFKNCTFTSCEATDGYGGGIWINTVNHNLTFDGCTISGNTGSKGGGFLYNQNSGTVIIKNSTLANNAATASTGLGGAIYASGAGTIELFNTSMSGNGTDAQAQHGGVIWMGGTIELAMHDGCTVSNNKVSSRGGAVLVAETAKFSANSVLFSGNNAANGGVIHVNGGTASVLSCEFSGNSATNGGAIRADGGVLAVDGCEFSQNSASGGEGGAINIKAGPSDVTIKNSSISDCSAKTGAGVCISQTNGTTYVPVSLYNTSIVNNTASAGPGGLYSVGKNDLLLVNCTVSSNTGTNGGGVYVTRYNSNSSYITRLSMVSCTVTNNTASAGCGGVYKDTYGQVVDVYNCIISGNTGTDTNDDVRNERLLYHVTNSIVADTSYASADRVNNTSPVGNFQWRTSTLSVPSVFSISSMLSSLSGDVHIVNDVSDNPARLCGMADLSSLSLSYTPTQTVETSYFAQDQKGNKRNGTIMGAYVLTE